MVDYTYGADIPTVSTFCGEVINKTMSKDRMLEVIAHLAKQNDELNSPRNVEARLLGEVRRMQGDSL